MPVCPGCSERVAAGQKVCPFCNTPMGGASKGKGKGRPAARKSAGGGGGANVLKIVLFVVLGGGVLVCCGGGFFILPGIVGARTIARTQQSKNNLKETGLNLHGFHDRTSAFPTGTFDEQGRPMHSWWTHLCEHSQNTYLYREIKIDKPWDDAANAQAMGNTVRELISPHLFDQPHMRKDPQGRGLSHYPGNTHFFPKGVALKLADIKDGTSTTIVMGEAAGGFKPWGDPTNLRDPAAGLGSGPDQYGSPLGKETQMLMADGAVKSINPNISPDVLKALATPAGGEPNPELK